jgi:hypothetical protein
MELTNLSKKELLGKCVELGFTKCKSKNKTELIELINSKTISTKTQIEFVIEDTDTSEEIIEQSKSDNVLQTIDQLNQINTSTNIVVKSYNIDRPHLKPLIKWSGGKSDERAECKVSVLFFR